MSSVTPGGLTVNSTKIKPKFQNVIYTLDELDSTLKLSTTLAIIQKIFGQDGKLYTILPKGFFWSACMRCTLLWTAIENAWHNWITFGAATTLVKITRMKQ